MSANKCALVNFESIEEKLNYESLIKTSSYLKIKQNETQTKKKVVLSAISYNLKTGWGLSSKKPPYLEMCKFSKVPSLSYQEHTSEMRPSEMEMHFGTEKMIDVLCIFKFFL